MPPKDLDKLVKIPDEDVASGKHRLARCVDDGCYKCMEAVRYLMVVEEYPYGNGNYTTDYFCEKHKIDDPT